MVHRNRKIYHVEERDGDDLRCKEVILKKVNQNYVDMQLPFDMVGVHEYGGMKDDDVHVNVKDLTGKAMKCGAVLTEWLPEWTMSKMDY